MYQPFGCTLHPFSTEMATQMVQLLGWWCSSRTKPYVSIDSTDSMLSRVEAFTGWRPDCMRGLSVLASGSDSTGPWQKKEGGRDEESESEPACWHPPSWPGHWWAPVPLGARDGTTHEWSLSSATPAPPLHLSPFTNPLLRSPANPYTSTLLHHPTPTPPFLTTSLPAKPSSNPSN